MDEKQERINELKAELASAKEKLLEIRGYL